MTLKNIYTQYVHTTFQERIRLEQNFLLVYNVIQYLYSYIHFKYTKSCNKRVY